MLLRYFSLFKKSSPGPAAIAKPDSPLLVTDFKAECEAVVMDFF